MSVIPAVRGQIWQDNDHRANAGAGPRLLRVVEVFEQEGIGYVVFENINPDWGNLGHRTRVKARNLDRFRIVLKELQ